MDLFTKCFESYLVDSVLYTTVIFCAGLCILGYCCAAELTYMCCLCMWAVGGGGGHTRHTFANIDLSICRECPALLSIAADVLWLWQVGGAGCE